MKTSLKVRHGQVHMKRKEKSFIAVFRHLSWNVPPNFQVELLQKSCSKDINGFDLCSLTSYVTVNPWQQEVIAAGSHFGA